MPRAVREVWDLGARVKSKSSARSVVSVVHVVEGSIRYDSDSDNTDNDNDNRRPDSNDGE